MGAIETVSWLRDCLREDRGRRGVRDFTSPKVQIRRFLTGIEKLATDELPSDVIAYSYGKRLTERIEQYRREREAVYGSIFLVGKLAGQTWCAPLILYPVEVSWKGVAAIDLAGWRLNPALRDELDLDDSFEEEVEELLGQGVLTRVIVKAIGARLAQCYPDLVTKRLNDFPGLAASGEVVTRKRAEGLELMPASAIGLIERSRGVRGILHELDQLIESGPRNWSRPLSSLLGLRRDRIVDDGKDARHVPAVLSEAQERIVRSARKNPLTLCHGPPGTGKSFTIAAIAIDHIARGQSVLIASEKDHAVDVASAKIREMMGGSDVTVRAGRSGYLRKLKRFVEDCLSGLQTADAPDKSEWVEARKELNRALRRLEQREKWLQAEAEKAYLRGELMADLSPTWWQQFQRGLVRQKIRGRPLMMEVSGELEETHRRRIRLASKFLRTERACLLQRSMTHLGIREHMQTFLRGLRKRKPGDQEKILRGLKWDGLAGLLGALPVWLVRLSDAHRVLPMQKEVFDVVIIDESTQCDLASVLPILQRAKRVVIAGDARQLRHLPFVSRKRIESFAKKHRIGKVGRHFFDYRDRSLMDAAIERAVDQRQIGFLNEHFRSRRPIIAFSNERFYSGRIRLMTERPWESEDLALGVEHCGGVRNRHGVNLKEVSRLIRVLKTMLLEHRDGPHPSIGILSPFRNQVELLRERLESDLPPELYHALTRDHGLLLGTAHSFQGEERDVMLLSFVTDPKSPAAVLRFLERPDVFNVSITRARNHQRVFTSVQPSDLPRQSLLADYLRFAERSLKVGPRGQDIPDRLADEVEETLRHHGITVTRATTLAGVAVDLLATRDGKAAGIDLIGHPGEFRAAVEQERIRVLARAGFVLLPLGLAEWQTRKGDVLKEVLRYL